MHNRGHEDFSHLISQKPERVITPPRNKTKMICRQSFEYTDCVPRRGVSHPSPPKRGVKGMTLN